MGTDFVWKDTFGFKSEGILDLFAGDVQTRLLLDFTRGILSVGLSKQDTYYQCLPGEGWTEKWNSGLALWGLWKHPTGIVASLGYNAQVSLIIHGIGSTSLASEVILGVVQPPNKGDGIIEFMELRVEGEYADANLTFYVSNNSATSNGATQTLPDWEYALESVENSSDVSSRTHTYRIVSRDPLPSRAIAQRLFIRFTSSGASYTINEVTLRAIVQSGGQAVTRLASEAEKNNLAYQQFFLSSLIQRYTRQNPLTDMFGNGDLTEI
jgi:hypothetical protein